MRDLAQAFEQPHDRQSRLLALGLSETTIVEIAQRGVIARRSATAFDPPSFPGTSQWAMMHRASRELLVPRRWEPDDSHNFSRVVRFDGAVALTVATGDQNTGRSSAPDVPQPSTKYAKGPETGLAVAVNEQLQLWNEGGTTPEALSRPARQTWWLLNAVVGDELRFELSLPQGTDERGFINSWSERIIFAPLSLDAASELPHGGDDDEPGAGAIDVPVERL